MLSSVLYVVTVKQIQLAASHNYQSHMLVQQC